MYTSPHLIDYNERIQINGENISDEDDNRIDALKREVELSFAKRNPGHPVCVWSVEKSSVDMNSVESDFPFYRKIV